MRGRFLTAREQFQRCIDMARERSLGRIAVANQPMAAACRWFGGDTAGALADALAAIDAAATVGHRRAEMVSHHVAYFCRHSLCDFAVAWKHIEASLALADQLKAPRFEAEALGFRAELHRQSGRISAAIADVEHALAISRKVGMDYMGPVFLGTLAITADDPLVRESALLEGETLLSTNLVGHNHFLFRRYAIEACLDCGEWDEAARHAAALKEFARLEPVPWTEFVVAHGQALAEFGQGRRDDELAARLDRLKRDADRFGYLIGLPKIEAALAGLKRGT